MDILPDSVHIELEGGNSAEILETEAETRGESRSRIAKGLDVTKSVLKTTRHITTTAFPATERVVGKAFDATGKVVQYGGLVAGAGIAAGAILPTAVAGWQCPSHHQYLLP